MRERLEEKYIALRLEDQSARRAKFGNSACDAGTQPQKWLRRPAPIFQNLLWMACSKYRTRSLRELEQQEFVGETERKQLEAAYDFLLRTRTELHYHANRPLDALGKNLQPAVASGLGYPDRWPSRRIEKFMRDLYTHTRNISSSRARSNSAGGLALLPAAPSRLSLRAWLPKRTPTVEPVDGFLFLDGEICAASNRIFREHPRRLMRVFLQAQQRGLKLHPDLAQLIRSELSLVERDF